MFALLLGAVLAMPPIMSVDQITKGQHGTCLTVFEGDNSNVEPFAFVVKGVMRGFLGPNKHLILVRLQGDKPEFTGVVAGMSGSPCSIEGQLIGALSYAFATFAKEPIAGITPMHTMLEALKKPKSHLPWRRDRVSIKQSSHATARTNDGAQPIATPLTLGGFLPVVRKHFAPWIEEMGFIPVAGGSTGGKAAQPMGLVPGGAIAAVLVSGDIDIAATGTVTSVDGNAVLAFGHPFMGLGTLSIPMAEATILNTMSSAQRSFKMAQTGALVGEITSDRLTAIGGYIGPVPAMIPVTGIVTTPSGRSRFSFQVARDHALSPRFVAMGIANALYGRVDIDARGTLRLEGIVKAQGFEPIKVRSVHASERSTGLFFEAAIDMASTFATLWNAPLGPPPRMALHVEATLTPEPIVEWIESLHLDRQTARPLERVSMTVRIRRENGGTRVEPFSLLIPQSWADQDIDLFATGAQKAQELAQKTQGSPRPTHLKQIRRWLSERRSTGNLYIMATRLGAGLRVQTQAMTLLPGSIVATFARAPNNTPQLRGIAWEEQRAQPGSLTGSAHQQIHILPY